MKIELNLTIGSVQNGRRRQRSEEEMSEIIDFLLKWD